MTLWSLPSQRPIACSDCPAFQRLHISARCVEDSFHRFCISYTTLGKKIYIRWCCIDQLSPHGLPEMCQGHRFHLYGFGVYQAPTTSVWFLTVKRNHHRMMKRLFRVSRWLLVALAVTVLTAIVAHLALG